LILVLALIGNLLVLIIIYGKKTKRKTPHDALIANLSIADISLVLSGLVTDYTGIPKSQIFCSVFYPLNTVTFFMSMFILATMADMRRRLILNPYKPKPTTRSVWITVFCLWFVSVLIVIPYVLVLRPTEDGLACYEQWPSDPLNQAYTLALTVIMYAIPITIIGVSYAKIVRYMRKHVRNVQGMFHVTRREDHEVMRALLLLVFLYTLLSLPLHIAWILLEVFDVKRAGDMLQYSNILVYLQSCCNPFVYGVITTRFRR
ncbi:predicted protein, partial [Nematostella vectensis]